MRVLAAIEPRPDVVDPDDRRRARLLTGFAAAMAAIMATATVVSTARLFLNVGVGPIDPIVPNTVANADPASTLMIAAAALAFAGCVHLCRSPRFEQGAWATVLTLNAFIFLMGLLNPEAAASLAPGFAASVVLATITLDARWTIVQGLIAAALGLTLLLVTAVPPTLFGSVVGITGTIMALTVVVAIRREGDLRQVLRLKDMEHAEAMRIQGELDLARKVQLAMLPQVTPRVDGLDIAAFSQPAHEASGDFYDLFTRTDPVTGRETLALVVADVAGKGIASALVMSATKVAIRAEASRTDSPAAVLAAVNDTLVSSIPASLFVTACYGVFDPCSQSLRHASAGHPHPVLWDCAAGVVRDLESFGLPLGLVADNSYTDRHTDLAPGDLVVLFSDGIVEAHGPGRGMYGFDRMGAEVRRVASRPGSAQVRLDALLAGMAAFMRPDGAEPDRSADGAVNVGPLEGLELEDDVTVLSLAVTAPVPADVAG